MDAIREEGAVIETSEKTATVRIDRTSACAHCKAGCMDRGGVMVTEAENSIGAEVGDTVRLEFSQGAALTAIMLVFGLPLLTLLLGVFLGAIVASRLGYQDHSHLMSIGIGAVLFFATFIPIWLYDKHMRESEFYSVAVVKILKKESPDSQRND